MKMINKELASELGKTTCAVEKRLGTLKLRRYKKWTPEREQFLRENYNVMSNAFLAKKLGITELAVAKKLSRMGLIRKGKRKWSKKKEEFLRMNYKRLSVDELAAECGMLPDYIRNKMTELQIR
jgi:biotin operon repressor